MFCALGLIFGSTEDVGSRSHVLRARTHFQRYRGRQVAFYVLRARTQFGRYRGRRISFSSFARPDSFSAVRRASAPVFMFSAPDSFSPVPWARWVPFSSFARRDSFWAVPRASAPVSMFCTPGLILGGTESVGSCIQVLGSRTRFLRYRGCRVPFSCFARHASFSTVPMASGPVFKFCAPGLVFGGNVGVGSRFQVLRSRTHFRRNRGRRVPFSSNTLPDSFSAVLRASSPVFNVLRCQTHFRRHRGRRLLFSYFAFRDSF
jgi:hypothetical protein